MGFELLDKRIAADDKARLVDDDARRQDADEQVRREPGRLSRVYELLGTQTLDAQAQVAASEGTPRGTPVPFGEPARSPFDVFRMAGLRDVVHELARVRARHALIEPTINAVDPQLMTRPHLATEASPSAGRALWRAAERRAATLYRHAVDEGQVASDDPIVEEALARCGSGAALSDEIRRKMEALLGVRLDRVRIHTDAVAQDAARAVRAQAFTVGEDIFFGANKYAPDTKEGQKLLAHELQHVVQAWQGRTTSGGGGVRVSDPNESLEREAEATSARLDRADRPQASGLRPQVAGRAPQSRFAPAPTAARSMLLRKAEAVGDKKHDKKFTLTTNVTRNKGAEQAHKLAHKAQKAQHADVAGAIASFKDQVHKAKASPLDAMKQTLDAQHKVDHRPKLEHAASHAKEQGKHHQQQAHEHAKKHAAKKHDHHGKHEHDAPAGSADHAGAHAGIQFKPISNWDRYMPEAMPGQDAREKKRILKLVQKKINSDRSESAKGFAELRKQQVKQAGAVSALQPGLVARISGAQAAALGTVSSAEAAQAAAIQASIAAAQGQVRAAAAAAKGQVTAAHAAAIAQINAATQAADKRLETGQQQAISQIDAATSMELVQVAMKFMATKAKIIALGAAKAGEASALGNMSLPYSGDKLKAAKQAAEQVAEQYASAMPENASEAADQIGQEQPKTESQVRELGDKQKQTVREQYQKAKAAVKAAHQSSMQAANAMKTQTLALIDQTSATSCAQLSALGASQVSAVHGQAASAKAGISSAGAAAISGVKAGVQKAVQGIMGGAAGIVEGAKHIETPDPDMTEKAVKHKQSELGKSVKGIAAGLHKSADSAAAGMSAQAAGAAKGMAATAAAAKASATQMAAGAKQTVTQAAHGAQQSLQQVAKGHQQQTEKIAEGAEHAFSSLVDGTRSAFDGVNGKLQSGLDGAVSDMQGKFNEAVPGQERAKILSEAAKAAAKVKDKPWWQKALAVVVSVIVTVVVTVALTAVLGPLGPIVAAVIAGAIGGALGKIAENLVMGDKWSSGVVEAALLGGISGGISAGFASGAGIVATKLASSESTLVSGVANSVKTALVDEAGGLGNYAIRAGTGFVGDQLGDVGSQLIVTGKYEFDIKNVVTSVATNAITGSKKFIDVQDRVESTSAGSKVKNWREGVQDDIKDTFTGKKGEGEGGGDGHGHDAQAENGHHGDAQHPQQHADQHTPQHEPAKSQDAGHDPGKSQAKHEQHAPAKEPQESHTQELGHDQPPAEHGQQPGKEPKQGSDHTAHEHAHEPHKHAADDKHAGGDKAHEAGDKHAADDTHAGEKHAADKAPHAKEPAKHADKAHEHDKAHEKAHEKAHDEHDKAHKHDKAHEHDKKHGEHDKKHDGKHAKADNKHHKGADHDQGAQNAGEQEGAAHESAEDAALDDVGYHEGTEAAAHEAIQQIESGRTPAKNKLRDTAKNEEGRKELDKLSSDPDLEPEDRQHLHQELANELRSKEHPTGDLAGDLHHVIDRSAEHEGDGGAAHEGEEHAGHEGERGPDGGHDSAKPEKSQQPSKSDKGNGKGKRKGKGNKRNRKKTPIRNRPKGPRSRGRKPGKH